jgi:predicted XRE-type DNA-binding protein
MLRPTDYKTEQRGVQITVRDVPTTFSEAGEELGFDLKVMRQLDALIAQALETLPASPEATSPPSLYLAYAEVLPAADPVSLELRRALRARRMNSAQLAQKLGVTPPVVSRWLSPEYHAHGMDALRRMAEVLDMDVEVRLVPRRVD